LRSRVAADEVLKNRQHVAAILDDPLEQRPQPGLANRFPIPLCKHCRRDSDISAKLVCSMATQKKPIEKGRFALRELEILQRVFYRVRQGRHIEIAVYRFRLARQEAFRSDVFMDNIAPLYISHCIDRQHVVLQKSLRRQTMIKKVKEGYKVLSEKGKNLGGPYKSKSQAEKRLKQVEYFKHRKG
jgi:hypothetical protein